MFNHILPLNTTNGGGQILKHILYSKNYFRNTIRVQVPNCLYASDIPRSIKFCQRGSNFEVFVCLFFDEGKEDPSTTNSGPSSAHQQNAFRWRFSGVLMVAQH